MRCTRLAEIQDAKIAILAQSHNFLGLYLCNWGTYRQLEKNLLNTDTAPTCGELRPLNGSDLLASLGHPCNFNGFYVLAALLHSTLVVGVSQTLRRWTENATYIRQGDHHVGHWPTFYSCFSREAYFVRWTDDVEDLRSVLFSWTQVKLKRCVSG